MRKVLHRMLACAALAAAMGFSTSSYAARLTARRALGAEFGEITITEKPVDKIVDAFQRATGANLVVDWNALLAASIAKDTPVTLNLHHVSLRTALKTLMTQVAPSSTPLAYYVEDNVITLTTQDEADKHLVMRVYDINDLVMPRMNLQLTTPGSLASGTSSANSQAQGSNGSSQTGGIFGQRPTQTTSDTTNVPAETKEDRGKKLQKAVTDAFRPTIWKENGGNATCEYFDGKLIVTAPYDVQEAIGGPVPDKIATVAAAH